MSDPEATQRDTTPWYQHHWVLNGGAALAGFLLTEALGVWHAVLVGAAVLLMIAVFAGIKSTGE